MILIAYDGSADARAAIEQGARLAHGDSARVLTVWTPFVDMLARSGAGLGLVPGTIDYEQIDRAAEESARKRADEGVSLARRLGLDATPCTVAQRTTTSEAILDQAAELDAQAILIGSRGRAGLKSLLLGSVSHGVVQHADRPVIVVPSPDVARERAERRRHRGVR
ncbi:MAG TPA: universal stress protein [Solirubrobacteraceae bacterium]|nr:universal stress protein [Solirubrobacteraceae bacterium]